MSNAVRCTCAHCRLNGLTGPAVLITVGVLFLARELGWNRDIWELWPVILIVIGAVKLLQAIAPTTGHISAQSGSTISTGEASNG